MKELKAAQDDAVRARLRGASLFEDNINQKKENQELNKKHEGALADAHNLRQNTDVRPPRAQPRMQSVPATGAGPSSYAPAYAEVPDDAFPVY